MTTVQHSEECRRRHVAAEAWWAAHPAACQRCMATGVVGFEDPDTGYSAAEDCTECIDKGRCPLCGGPLPETWERLGHLACGWRAKGEGAPYDPQSEAYCCEVAWPEEVF